MAWLRYNDSWEQPDYNPKAFVIFIVLAVLFGMGLSADDLWRDGQHHHFVWWHLWRLLASLYLAALISRAARRAWRSVRAKRRDTKQEGLTRPPRPDQEQT